MSLTTVEPRTARLNRSEQAVPGSNLRFMERAAGGDADVVFLDLEDAVAPGDKERARKQVIEALHDLVAGSTRSECRRDRCDRSDAGAGKEIRSPTRHLEHRVPERDRGGSPVRE